MAGNCCHCMVDLTIEEQDEINLSIEGDGAIEFSSDEYIRASDYPTYDGPVEVDPKFYEQSLATKDKVMGSNVTVHAIAVSTVENLAGGNTVYIGGEINYG